VGDRARQEVNPSGPGLLVVDFLALVMPSFSESARSAASLWRGKCEPAVRCQRAQERGLDGAESPTSRHTRSTQAHRAGLLQQANTVTYCESRPPGQAVVAVRSSSKGVPAPPQLASPLLAHLAAWTPCWRARRRSEPEMKALHAHPWSQRVMTRPLTSSSPPPPFRPVGTDPSLADDMAGPGSSFGARRKAVKKGLQFTLLVVGASSTRSTVSSS